MPISKVSKSDDKILLESEDGKKFAIPLKEPLDETFEKALNVLVSRGVVTKEEFPKLLEQMKSMVQPVVEEIVVEEEHVEEKQPAAPPTTPPPPELPEIPAGVNIEKLRTRYEEMKDILAIEQVLDLLSNEFSINTETVAKLLNIQFGTTSPPVSPPTPQQQPQPQPPQPKPVTVSPPPSQVPLTTFAVPQQVQVDVSEEINKLSKEQLEWVRKLSEIYNTDTKTFLQRCLKEKAQSPTPTTLYNILFGYALKHGFIKSSTETAIHVLLVNRDGVLLEFLTSPDNAKILQVDKCITVGDIGFVGRIVVASPPKKQSMFPDLPFYQKISEAVEVPSIPRSMQILARYITPLIELYHDLAKKKSGYAVVSARILDVNKPREDLWYIKVDDGTLSVSNVPTLMNRASIGPITPDLLNMWGIKEEEMDSALLKNRTILVYGNAVLIPPSETFSKESINIYPEFVYISPQ
jgi:hypothetical protein